jgi:pyridoxamine 5'-phosphate oxidase
VPLERLDESALDPDPIRQFELWLADAQAAGIVEPLAMTLATADRSGHPSARMVLLRGVDERGFVFYTNRESEKGREMEANPLAALVFHWDRLGRQVRVSGRVEQVDRAESETYWAGRPRGHRLAAWASEQSAVVASRADLEKAFAEVESRFPGDDVPLPPFWGGYRVVPDRLEFWLSREDRLHDRMCYRRDGATWVLERLAP